MANEFQYDVFLNHNTKDKARVRRLAEPLRVAGLLVWFDEWVINPGDDIYLAIKRGLEAACVHAFPAVDSQRRRMQCLSPVALGSDCLGLTRRAKPTTDGPEVFAIKKDRHVGYWMNQQFPVLLVVREFSLNQVRWMEIRDYLMRESDNGKKPVHQIVFLGERFDVMSVRRWRERVLGLKHP